MSDSRILMAQSGTHATIKVEGRGSFQNAAAFKHAGEQLMGKGARQFAIDLSACAALDSTFIGIMIGFALRLKEAGGLVSVIEANTAIVKLFNDVGLDRLFDYNKS